MCSKSTMCSKSKKVQCCAALTFVGIGVFDVGLQVMLGRLDRLADSCFVSGKLSKAERIELMKSRLKPLSVQTYRAP